MKLIFENKNRESIINLARKLGYIVQGEREGSEYSLVRPLDRNPYPRFHLYLHEEKNNSLIFNLHLDQKRPIYQGVSAHAGEYDGPVVENEMARIKKALQ